MDLSDRLKELAARIPNQVAILRTEEATKNALIMPFITALGYNVFDPLEVTPELDADVGLKKGEKVDYAILKDGKPIMLFECKASSANLDEVHASQLFRYFAVTEARVAVLTNGITYRFFADLEAPNKMDARPFLEVNLLALDDIVLTELKKFSKASFDLGAILTNASELKYTREIKRILAQEILQPSEDFVRFFTSRVYSGRMTHTVREQFSEITKRALQQFVSERVSDRLKMALEKEEASGKEAVAVTPEAPAAEALTTTDEERQGYFIVQAILAQIVEAKRVVMRDQKTFCSVLLDDSNRRPICRLWFNTAQKYLGLFDSEKVETKLPLAAVEEIYSHAEELRNTALRYLTKEN